MSQQGGTHTEAAAPAPTGFRRYQWRVLGAAMFCYLFYYTGRQTFGFAIPGIREEFGVGNTEVGIISGALLWAYAGGQFINGNLADKFGGRRTMTIGAVLSCALNWLLSFSAGIRMVGVSWGLNGYVQALGWPSGSHVISNWWHSRERGKAFGFYTFAAGMASVLAYVTSVLIVDTWGLGWRWIFRLPVLLMLVGGIAFFLIARNRPEDVGYESPHIDTDNQVNRQEDTSVDRYKAVLRRPALWVAGLSIGLLNAARYGLLVWVPVYFLATETPLWISVTLPVGMAIGALSNGILSDKFFGSNRSRAIFTFLALATLAAVAMYLVPRETYILPVVALFATGFLVYGPQSSFWALCPDMVGAARAGTAVGVLDFFAYVIAGIGEPVIGYVLDATGNVSLVFAIVAMCCGLGAIASLGIRR